MRRINLDSVLQLFVDVKPVQILNEKDGKMCLMTALAHKLNLNNYWELTKLGFDLSYISGCVFGWDEYKFPNLHRASLEFRLGYSDARSSIRLVREAGLFRG